MHSPILEKLRDYYTLSQKVSNEFGGPSIYFHRKALEWREKDFLSEKHIEYIYAVLTSWGMHRMGKRGAKMPSFDVFKESVMLHTPILEQMKKLRIETITQEQLDHVLPQVTDVCFQIKASIGQMVNGLEKRSKIVSSSKVLAHILPDLICPIDRQYTLTFFQLKIHTEQDEINAFQIVIRQMWEFFHYYVDVHDLSLYDPFGGSYPKIFDNMIIAYQKNNTI